MTRILFPFRNVKGYRATSRIITAQFISIMLKRPVQDLLRICKRECPRIIFYYITDFACHQLLSANCLTEVFYLIIRVNFVCFYLQWFVKNKIGKCNIFDTTIVDNNLISELFTLISISINEVSF